MSELKPCPFCGGKADFDYDDSGYNWVFCTKCGVTTDTDMHYEFDARLRLAKAWNIRADGWIGVDDRFPEIGQQCLIEIPVCDNFNIENGKYKGSGVWIGAWCDSRGNGCPYKVTRWMPRP